MTDTLNITGNETPEELEAMLEQFDDFEVTDESWDEDDEVFELDGSETEEEPKVDSNTESAPVVDGESKSEGEEQPASDKQEESEREPVVKTEDGKHEIPFEVLKQEREKNKALEQELEELRGKGSEADKLQRIIDVRNEQLTALGVKPKDLPEDIRLTPEEKQKLMDEYPEIGRALVGVGNQAQSEIQALKEQVSKLTGSQPAEPSAPDEQVRATVHETINSIPDLKAMADEGGDEWAKALELDASLQNDPQWRDKPLSERFQEVTNQVVASRQKAQEMAEQAAQQALDDEAQKVPASPSEVGTSHSHQPTIEERMASATPDQLLAMFDGMDLNEIEQYL